MNLGEKMLKKFSSTCSVFDHRLFAGGFGVWFYGTLSLRKQGSIEIQGISSSVKIIAMLRHSPFSPRQIKTPFLHWLCSFPGSGDGNDRRKVRSLSEIFGQKPSKTSLASGFKGRFQTWEHLSPPTQNVESYVAGIRCFQGHNFPDRIDGFQMDRLFPGLEVMSHLRGYKAGTNLDRTCAGSFENQGGDHPWTVKFRRSGRMAGEHLKEG